MSAVKSAGLRLTGSAPVGSVESGAELLAAALDSGAAVLGGVVADGVVAPLVQPAHRIVAAIMSGSARCFISEFLPRDATLRRASHRTDERPVRRGLRRVFERADALEQAGHGWFDWR